MAYGRELRVPILDHRLVEFAIALPNAYKIGGGQQRTFYRDALKRVFPGKLVEMPKRAVVDPQRDWLRGPLEYWVQDIFESRSFRERGICNADSVLAVFEDYKLAEGELNSFHLWQWISLELWFRTFIDRAPGLD